MKIRRGNSAYDRYRYYLMVTGILFNTSCFWCKIKNHPSQDGFFYPVIKTGLYFKGNHWPYSMVNKIFAYAAVKKMG